MDEFIERMVIRAMNEGVSILVESPTGVRFIVDHCDAQVAVTRYRNGYKIVTQSQLVHDRSAATTNINLDRVDERLTGILNQPTLHDMIAETRKTLSNLDTLSR